MKRFSIILLGALAIMMAGCSKDVHTASKEPASDDWLVNLELPVPIEFGSGSISTKASFNSMDDLLTVRGEKSYPFGVFAIDKSTESIKGDELLLNNERAIYIETDEGKVFQFANTGNVEQPKYYPMVSDRSFDFYGYYSRQTSMELSESEETPTRLSVDVKVGSLDSDILWAKATTGVGQDGYNARYIRQNRDKKPVLNFKHVTSCLKFKAVYAPNNDETPEMSEIKVSSLTIKNIHTDAKLCVIDIAESENESELTVTGDPTDVLITGSNAYKTNLIQSKNQTGEYTAALLCDDFFIAPQNEALDVQFVIKYTPVGGSELSQTVTYTLDPSELGASSNGDGQIEDEDGNVLRLFEAGYQYGFSLKIYSPEKISIDVELEPYKDAFGDDGFADIVIE